MKSIFIITSLMLLGCGVFAQDKKHEEPSKTEKQTVILFKTTVCDIGSVEHGAEAKAIFTFKNITKKPIKLTNVKASCGCTAVDWPREEVAKKKKQKISITYDSNRVGRFSKTVYVYIDGQENPIQLEIRGEVLPQSNNQQNNSNSKITQPVEMKNASGQPVKVAEPKTAKPIGVQQVSEQKVKVESGKSIQPKEKINK